MSQSKYWLFTINNPDLESDEVLEVLENSDRNIRFCVFQREIGSEGTPHYQGYVVFSRRVDLRVVRRLFPRAHWERRQGNHAQAKEYCSKADTRDEGPWTYGSDDGIPAGQGARSDIIGLKRALDDGKHLAEVAEEFPRLFMTMNRGIHEYKKVKTAHRDFAPEVIVLIGPTRTGKSRWMRDNMPNAHWATMGKWMDGYDPNFHTSVVFDDFCGGDYPFRGLLRLLDRYPYTAAIKGSGVVFRPRFIGITSNNHPRVWYSDGINPAPLLSRIAEFGGLFEVGRASWRELFIDQTNGICRGYEGLDHY